MKIHIKVKAVLEKGKANVAVIKLLEKHFKKKVKIISGHTTKRKVIELQN